MSKFLLLLGPSGVGKSTVIKELFLLDDKFVYISPYMTRPLREGEKDKVSVSDKVMDEMNASGEFLVINQLYGIRYATPRKPIVQALSEGRFPVLDWPISRLSVMTTALPNQLYIVYASPPSIEALSQRLAKDGRDKDGSRLKSASEELETFWSGGFAGMYDFDIVTESDKVPEIAKTIYTNYLQSFQ